MGNMLEELDGPYHGGSKRLKINVNSPLGEILAHPGCPLFIQNSIHGKVSWQKRNEYTLIRTLIGPSIAPQFIGTLLAWGTWVDFDNGNESNLLEVIDDTGKTKTIEALSIPMDINGRMWAEARTGSTPNDIPIVWAFAVIDRAGQTVKYAHIALSGIWRQSVALAQSAELLVGTDMKADDIERVAEAVAAEAAPVGDYRGSSEYRKAMAGVMTRRALHACLEGSAI